MSRSFLSKPELLCDVCSGTQTRAVPDPKTEGIWQVLMQFCTQREELDIYIYIYICVHMHRVHTHPEMYTCAFCEDRTALKGRENTGTVGQVFLKAESGALVPFLLEVMAKIWSGFPPIQDQGGQVHLAQFPRHIKTKTSKNDNWAKISILSITEHCFTCAAKNKKS